MKKRMKPRKNPTEEREEAKQKRKQRLRQTPPKRGLPPLPVEVLCMVRTKLRRVRKPRKRKGKHRKEMTRTLNSL